MYIGKGLNEALRLSLREVDNLARVSYVKTITCRGKSGVSYLGKMFIGNLHPCSHTLYHAFEDLEKIVPVVTSTLAT